MRKRGTQSAAAVEHDNGVANGASADNRTLDMFREPSTPKNDSKPQDRFLDQENLSSIVTQLEARGYSVTLPDVAGWIVQEREMVTEWLRGDRSAPPGFLTRYVVPTHPKPGIAKAERPSNDADAVPVTFEDRITVSWGNEKFGMPNYSSFEVGLISATIAVKPGESRVDVARRAYLEIEKLGEELRERKRDSFLAALKRVHGEGGK